MTVPTSNISLEHVRIESGLVAPTSLSACIAAAGKIGTFNSLSQFAGYTRKVLTASPTNLSYGYLNSYKNVNVTSNTTWSVVVGSAYTSWILISGASGINSDTFSIRCLSNYGSNRNGYVDLVWSGTNRRIYIFQEGSGSSGCCDPYQP